MNPLAFAPAVPELFLALAAMAVLIADLAFDPARDTTFRLTLAVLVATGALVLGFAPHGGPQRAFGGMFVSDTLSIALKLAALICAIVTLVYARRYARDRAMLRGEFCVLASFAVLGQMVMVSSGHLLVLYLGLEMMSLSLYALVALRRDSPSSTEASMKYFVLGALSSGFILYGMSMVYGATGGVLDLPGIAKAAAATRDSKILVLGIVFLVAGIGFKLSAAPFHMWAPDVYDGAPTAVTLMIATGSKLASFGMALRLLVSALPAISADWQQMMSVLAILSLSIGNLTAIAQTNLKRMLAYSTIGQIGFVLLGLMSGVTKQIDGYGAAMYYVVVYVFTTLGTFGIVMLLARPGFEADRVSDLAGLARRAPGMAFVMLLLMFSLAGIPPTVGFHAKLVVLQATIGGGYLGLAIFAVLASLVAAFYYLRIVKTMYFDPPTDPAPVDGARDVRLVLGLNGAFVLVAGLAGEPLLRWCLDSVRGIAA